METEETTGNFIINLSTIQKLFLLFAILNLASDGNWLALLGADYGHAEMYLATNIVCGIGFFLFWPPKLKL
jgi:hypothetical protein